MSFRSLLDPRYSAIKSRFIILKGSLSFENGLLIGDSSRLYEERKVEHQNKQHWTVLHLLHTLEQ